jgi:hypothetical protein
MKTKTACAIRTAASVAAVGLGISIATVTRPEGNLNKEALRTGGGTAPLSDYRECGMLDVAFLAGLALTSIGALTAASGARELLRGDGSKAKA